MRVSTPLARRFGAPSVLFIAVSALSGCATNQQQFADSTDDLGGAVSARDYGYVRPAGDLSTRRGIARQSQPSGDDLWSKVRAGMKLGNQANARVDSKINAFRRDPQYLTKLSERAKPYLHVVIGEIERRGLPAELALLPHVESRYNPAATSPVAAAGMWQFMPYTGREMGLRQDAWQDERRDILASTRAAMDYLQQLHRRLGGSWELAMAAYNCGPGRVESAQAANRQRGQPTDFWSLNLPAETENYVPQILAASRLVAEPARYGMRLPPVPTAPQLEVVRTERPLDLMRVAQASGVGLAQLQTLNAGLKRGQTSPLGPGQLVVPAGTGQRVTNAMPQARVTAATAVSSRMPATYAAIRPAAAAPERPQLSQSATGVYKVKSGETLAAIARTRGIDPGTLADLNAMQPGEPLLPGQSLRVPSGIALTGPSNGSLVTHQVRKGESLDAIARRYGVTVDELVRWNPVAGNDLRKNKVLRIYRRNAEFAS